MKTNLALILCISLVAVCAGARRSRNSTVTSTSTTTTTTTTSAPTTSSSTITSTDSNVTTEPNIQAAEQYYDHVLESAKKAILTFALDFQRCAYTFAAKGKNILFSPTNIAALLANVLLGADGNTKSEILNVFGVTAGKDLSQKENQVHLALGSIFDNFTIEANSNPATKVEVAQSIFLQNGTSIKEFFYNFSQTVYKNEINEIDFASTTEEATDIINKWIANRTQHRIEKLLHSPLEKNTKMILANTLFFNGEWEHPFLNESKWKPFYTETGKCSVKMMTNVAPAYVFRDHTRNYCVLGVPYKGDNIVMYIILPNEKESLQKVLANLTNQDLIDFATKSEKVDDQVYEIPYMDIGDEIELRDILETIGIKSAFDAAHANFSNIADGIFISRIIHKTNLEVTEAGSTGSASTVAQIETKFPKEPFIVNRPFLVYVFHRTNSLISFWGTINSPVPNEPL